MGSELLERARSLRSAIDAAGAAAAATGAAALPQEVVDACFEAGLYGALSPRAVGGAEPRPRLSAPDESASGVSVERSCVVASRETLRPNG